jgi:hypothetical protein
MRMPPTDPPDAPSPSISQAVVASPTAQVPHSQILALLLAHILNNNYTIISLLASLDYAQARDVKMDEKLGVDLVISCGAALPLLWAYLWGRNADVEAQGDRKGKTKAADSDVHFGQLETGGNDGDERARLVLLTFKILLTAASASTPNLFLIKSRLPLLSEYLMTRLYGLEPKRHYEVTFPALDEWAGEEEAEAVVWTAPSEELRVVYLGLLRKLLETGVDQTLTWRLFGLVKRRRGEASEHTKGDVTPAVEETPTASTSNDGGTSKSARRRPTGLQLVIPAASPEVVDSEDRLDAEVLDLIRHGMKARWPDVFVFRGGRGYDVGGIELRDMGKPAAALQKGFTFSVSLRLGASGAGWTDNVCSAGCISPSSMNLSPFSISRKSKRNTHSSVFVSLRVLRSPSCLLCIRRLCLQLLQLLLRPRKLPRRCLQSRT